MLAGSTAMRCRWVVALSVVLATASGCDAVDRLEQVGRKPPQSKMTNPAKLHDNQRVKIPMPAPRPEDDAKHPNSLWSPGSRAFFKDQRASEVGDILSVVIDIDDQAELENETTREREAGENAGLSNFLGLESQLDKVLPDDVDPANLVNANSESEHTGTGEIDREEDIQTRIATTVTQVLPNGNLVIAGRQEIRVNYENRILQVTGIVRPEDISSENEIQDEDIAEARVIYGGEGQLTDVQQPRYGQQIYDIIFPF
jgi:flagellar L-ring protein precursor FlgH